MFIHHEASSINVTEHDEDTQVEQFKQKKRLDIAIVGLPNAGKSQLLNALIGENVAAVSRKRHTTRNAGILGVKTHGDTQLCFVDTPGFLRNSQAKREGLDRELIVTASAEMENVDHTLLVVDAARTLTPSYKDTIQVLMRQALQANGREEFYVSDDDDEQDAEIVETDISQNEAIRRKFSVVLNKSDLVWPKTNMLDLAFEIGALAEQSLKEKDDSMDPDTIDEHMPMFFYTSARKNRGLDDLLDFLLENSTPCDVWEVEDADQTSTLTPQERVREIIHEKVYRCLHRELPHSVEQVNRLFQFGEGEPRTLLVHQDLVVKTKSHQELVRANLKRIKESAEKDLSNIFGQVHLHLHVKRVKSKNQ